jgi:hypothetical protein
MITQLKQTLNRKIDDLLMILMGDTVPPGRLTMWCELEVDGIPHDAWQGLYARLSSAIHLQGLARSYRAITTFLTWTIPATLRWWRWKAAPNLGPWKRTGVIGNKATGPGTIIQSNYGAPNHLGNFEVIVLEGTNTVFHYCDNSDLSWKFGGIITNSASG